MTQTLVRGMRDATEDLALSAEFTYRTVRAGRRRLAYVRLRLTAFATVLLVLAGGGAAQFWPLSRSDRDPAADAWMSRPTGGDLAGDARFLTRVRTVWRDGAPVSADGGADGLLVPRGKPHIYWAGATPAGPAAVVVQRVDEPDTETAVGLVTTSGGEPKVEATLYTVDDAVAFGFGAGDRTLLAAGSEPIYLSTEKEIKGDGRVVRRWRSLTVRDGVAVVQLPAGADVGWARIIASETPPTETIKDDTELIRLARVSRFTMRAGKPRDRQQPPLSEVIGAGVSSGLSWEEPAAKRMRVGHEPFPVGDDEARNTLLLEAVRGAGMLDVGAVSHAVGSWTVLAGLPDGRTAVVTEIQEDNDPSRLFGLLLRRDGSVDSVVAGGAVDPRAAIPVVMRLPDDQGWVVAAYGSDLDYQTAAGGPWIDAGRDAALLPAAATRVRAVAPAGGTSTVPLTG